MKVNSTRVATSISRPHNCTPDVHLRWKSAASVRYLRLNHQTLCDQNPGLTPKQLQSMERSRGNIISYSQAWRAITAAKKNAGEAGETPEEPPEEEEPDE